MTPAGFRKKVLSFYQKNGRDFPWRSTTNPYRILVSEIMLQQTQTHRVVPKYLLFLKSFPTLESLAQAKLPEVLKLWQGLGYNRRALMLHRAAQRSFDVKKRRYVLPVSYDELLKLPGIGPYTASAVMTFAHNEPRTMIETNIRAALIHEFFLGQNKVSDDQLLPILAKAIPQNNPREFYQALMDYGAFLKQKFPNPSRRSSHYTKQSKFTGSDRQIRGEIIRTLTRDGGANPKMFLAVAQSQERLMRIVARLTKEGLVAKKNGMLILNNV
jgi:A/G-specific adenine glycosylase